MTLAACLVVKDEVHRYLPLVIDHLREFCDEIVILDDGSTDGTAEWLADQPGLRVAWSQGFAEEWERRERLCSFAVMFKATHLLAVDADEFVADGPALRARLEGHPAIASWTLALGEVWEADAARLRLRVDGGWRVHERQLVWKPGRPPRFPRKTFATGRIPLEGRGQRSQPAGVELLHFGWTDPAERQERAQRYLVHDAGRFHAKRHLDSILWPRERISLREHAWPAGDVFFRLRERFAS